MTSIFYVILYIKHFVRMTFFKSPFEYFLLVVFILYLILPLDLPESIAVVVNTPLGIITMFLITVALFAYVNPILGVLYIFVAYELLRRSTRVTGKSAYIQYTPTQVEKNQTMRKMNPPAEKTLEEAIVEKMAPIGENTFVDGRVSNEKHKAIGGAFQPVSEDVHNASKV